MEVRSIEAIVRALNEADAQYLIVGGLAVNAHGFVRLTRDIDIVLGLGTMNATRGLAALLAIGYNLAIPARPEDFADAASSRRMAAIQRNDCIKTLERPASPDAG